MAIQIQSLIPTADPQYKDPLTIPGDTQVITESELIDMAVGPLERIEHLKQRQPWNDGQAPAYNRLFSIEEDFIQARDYNPATLDFAGFYPADTNWRWTRDTAGSILLADPETDHAGIIRFGTGGVNANDGMGLFSGQSTGGGGGNLLFNHVARMCFIVRTHTLIDSLRIRCGIDFNNDQASLDGGSDSIAFRFDPSINAKWQCITKNVSGNNTQAIGANVTANTWYKLEAFRVGVTWHFALGGIALATSNTFVPTTARGVFGTRIKQTTTAERFMLMDRMALGSALLNR